MLCFCHGDAAGEEEEVEGTDCGGGGGVFGEGFMVGYAADGWVVDFLGAGEAGGGAEVYVGAGGAGREGGGGGEGRERGGAGVAERVEVTVVGGEDAGFEEDRFVGGNV